MLKLHQKSARPAGRLFFAFYFGVHVLFCTAYMGGLLWWGSVPGYLVLAAIIGASSVWVYRQSRRFVQKGVANLSPVGAAFLCVVVWCIAFPVFLTFRQWLLRNGRI
jgi:hypothetical protein